MSLNPLHKSSNNSNSAQNVSRKAIGISVTSCLFVSLLVGVVGFSLGTRYNVAVSGLNYNELNEVYNTLKSRYNGSLDDDKLLQGAASGMAAAAGDKYTAFFTRAEAKELTSDLAGKFEGVGIELGQNSDKQLEVITPLDDSPAKAAGIRAGDVIAKINDDESISWEPEKAVTKIRGEAGTTVKLTIERDGELKEVPLVRAEITVASVKTEIKDNIGYIRISTFGDDTASLMNKAAQEFKDKGVKSVILDLRGNGGGYVSAAKSVASLWLKSGTAIVREKRGEQVIAVEKANGNAILAGVKTIVLIDGGSASASEIVAGALKDNGVATLVGKKSYGKGSVQELVDLRSGSVLKVTIAKWYTPNDKNIDGEGIEPDETVDMTSEEYNAGNDTQRNKAIELLRK